jgi:hypothetical protein
MNRIRRAIRRARRYFNPPQSQGIALAIGTRARIAKLPTMVLSETCRNRAVA